MARMRTLKPEFWDSPSTAQADLAVRLTFLAMWNWADDSGHGTANLKELEAFAFPNDEVTELPRRSSGNSAHSAGTWRNFSEILGEVAEAYGVVFYRVKGRPYYSIPSFRKHQSKDFRETSRYPKLGEGEIFDVTTGNAISSTTQQAPPIEGNSDPYAGSRGNSAHTSGESGLVIGEQGNRGIGEQTISNPPEQETITLINPEPSADASDRFDEFWEAYPKRTGQNPKKPAREKFEKITKDVDPQKLIDAAHAYARSEQHNDPKFIAQTITWLNQERWNDEYSEPAPQPFNPWETRNMTASQRRLQEGYEREQRILNGELDFTNTDNPYMQPRPPRQAIEGGTTWTPEQQ